MRLEKQDEGFTLSGLSETDIRSIMHVLQTAKSFSVGRDVVFGPSTSNLLLSLADGMRRHCEDLKGPSDSDMFLLPESSPAYAELEEEFHIALERYFPHLATAAARDSEQYLKHKRMFFAPFTVVETSSVSPA
jgi:hypothetical protein